MCGECFLREFIKLTGARVLLNLEIPGVGIKAAEPVSKSFETGPIQLLNFALQQLNFGHSMSLPWECPNGKGHRCFDIGLTQGLTSGGHISPSKRGRRLLKPIF